MSKVSRSISLLLVFIMVFSFVGCGSKSAGNQETTTAAVSKTESTAKATEQFNPMAKYDPEITLNIVRRLDNSYELPEGQTVDNNVWTKAYKEELGINLNVMWEVATDLFDQKLNTSIAAGEVPDTIIVNPTQYTPLYNQGLLQDLSEVYNKYASDMVKSMIMSDGGLYLNNVCTVGGKLMGIPQNVGVALRAQNLWVRADWLEKLGLPDPKNITELENIMDAFVNKDPDGNGKKDTTGMIVNKDLVWIFGVDGIFNAYNAYPLTYVKDPNADGIVYGGILPENKAALAKLQEYYKKGYINKEFGLTDISGKGTELAANDKAGVIYGQWWNFGWPMGACLEKGQKWKPLPLPTVDGSPVKMLVDADCNRIVVTKDCKHPEAVVKALNLSMEKLYGPNAKYGEYGIVPVKAKDENGNEITKNLQIMKSAVLGSMDPPDKDLTIYKNIQDALKTKDTSKLNDEEKQKYQDVVTYMETRDKTKYNNFLMYGEGQSLSVIDAYKTNNLIQLGAYYGAPTETMIAKATTLKTMQVEMLTKIIMGASLDEFDKFVADWKKLGGDQITKEINDWYKANK